MHARQCDQCCDRVRRAQLCEDGSFLAQKVNGHLYDLEGEVYSHKRDDDKLTRVELPQGCTRTRNMLQRYWREHGRAIPHDQEPDGKDRDVPSSDVGVNNNIGAKAMHSGRKSDARRRGSLYASDMERPETHRYYEVEIREPEPRRYQRARRRWGYQMASTLRLRPSINEGRGRSFRSG